MKNDKTNEMKVKFDRLDACQKIDEKIKLLVAYTDMKIREADWHGAIDALMDIRDLESEVQGMYRVPYKSDDF